MISFFGDGRVLFSLTALRLFSSSPLGKARERSLLSLAASVVNKENQKNFRRYLRIAMAASALCLFCFWVGVRERN